MFLRHCRRLLNKRHHFSTTASASSSSSSTEKIIFKRDEDSIEDGINYNELPTHPPRPSFASFENPLHPLSQTVVFDGAPDDPYKPSSTPLYQTSTFQQPDAMSFGKYDYTRSGNPTRTAIEKQVALLVSSLSLYFPNPIQSIFSLTHHSAYATLR